MGSCSIKLSTTLLFFPSFYSPQLFFFFFRTQFLTPFNYTHSSLDNICVLSLALIPPFISHPPPLTPVRRKGDETGREQYRPCVLRANISLDVLIYLYNRVRDQIAVGSCPKSLPPGELGGGGSCAGFAPYQHGHVWREYIGSLQFDLAQTYKVHLSEWNTGGPLGLMAP